MTSSRHLKRVSSDAGSADLQLLEQGKISLEEFVERRIEEALDCVKLLVTDEQKEELRILAREQVQTDPVLQDYLFKATGQLPEDPSTSE